MATLHIVDLESAINRCWAVQRYVDKRVAADLDQLTCLYGLMIYRKRKEVVLEEQAEALRAAVARWQHSSSAAGAQT